VAIDPATITVWATWVAGGIEGASHNSSVGSSPTITSRTT